MFRIVLLLSVVSVNSYGVDFEKYIYKMKKEMKKIFSSGKVNHTLYELPNIPILRKSATSVGVYDKSGNIFKQGVAFNKLPLSEKRKYRLTFLKELYFNVRGGQASLSELNEGVNILEQGGSREGVYRSLVLSRDYENLEEYKEEIRTKLVSFSLSFSEKYLALKFKKKQLERFNLWGLKRIILEKTLDIVDAFPKDGINLYTWYAVLSYEMSTDYSHIWKSKTRGIKEMGFHYHWAKTVPFQQIKSEVIIKLHKIMNSL